MSKTPGELKPPTPSSAMPVQAPAAVDRKWLAKKINGLVVFIQFPEFAELAEFLSAEGKQTFLDGFQKAIEHGLEKQPHWLLIHDEGSATVAIGDASASPFQKLMKFAEEIHKEMRIWTGAFGKIGVPPLKFRMGVTFGEIQISPTEPKISGQALVNAAELSEKFCEHFQVQTAVEGDLARFAEHAQEWIDLDDIDVVSTTGGASAQKRIFTKLLVREDPEDVQLFRSARKAYFQKDFVDAKAKFDRLTRIKQFKHLAEVYLKRLRK